MPSWVGGPKAPSVASTASTEAEKKVIVPHDGDLSMIGSMPSWVRGPKAPSVASTSSTEAEKEVIVPHDGSLGMDCDFQTSEILQIHEHGSVAEFNASHPEQCLQVGDVVCSVNSIRIENPEHHAAAMATVAEQANRSLPAVIRILQRGERENLLQRQNCVGEGAFCCLWRKKKATPRMDWWENPQEFGQAMRRPQVTAAL